MEGAPVTLSLRVLMRGSWSHDSPSLEAFIDGMRLGEGTEQEDFAGHFPPNVLRDDRLLSDEPRRVSLLCCSCGEPGCGEIAPLILRRGNRMLWCDFRAFWAAALDVSGADDPSRGEALGWPDLSFDLEQYVAEVDRAGSDRSWEPEGMLVAQLVSDQMKAEPDLFAGTGLHLRAVLRMRDSESICVDLEDDRRHGVRLIVPSPGTTPGERALAVIAALRATPAADWRPTFERSPFAI